MKAVIGIDIGGTNFRIGTVNEDSVVYNFKKKSSTEILTGDPVSALYSQIHEYMAEDDAFEYIAVSIGLPSIVSKDRKTIYSTPNLKGFDNINLTDPLSEKLGIPVYVDRDVNYLLENDIDTLGIDKKSLVAGFYIGTGFGNAISIDGRFLRGKNGAAGELGHIPLYGIDEKCTCGNSSCAETRCSGRRLEYLVAENFPDTEIREVFTKHSKNPVIVKYIRGLAVPIATEINILDPDFIIIAGGVVMMPDFPMEQLMDAVHDYVRKPYPDKGLSVLFTSHTQQSGVIGGAKYAFETIYKKKLKQTEDLEP